MAEVPAVTPASMPENVPIPATEGVETAQVPPVGLLYKMVESPVQTDKIPAMGDGSASVVI